MACDRIARLIAALDAEDADATLDELEACGEAALPALLEVVRDAARGDDARALAAVAIGHVTDAGPAALVPLLGDVDEDVADLAAFALRWPPPSWVAEPVLLEMLSHAEASRRRRALRGLRYIGVDLTEAAPPRIEAVAAGDPDPAVRAAARAVLDHLAE